MLVAALVAHAALADEAPRSDIATQADSAQHYDLFLPDGYPGERKWPVLIVLDPRGRGEAALAIARPGAQADGWIVLSSRNSRSDDREQLTFGALQALLREAGSRYAIDPRRVYIAGMSGTAKSLWVADAQLHGLVAGYIGSAGARPPELGVLHAPPPFFGFTGTRDFNHREMREFDDTLAQAGGAHRLEVFDGPHGWPAPEQFALAIDWLELQAMRDGPAPRREPWIDEQLAKARAHATAAGLALEKWRRHEAVARDFEGLRDVTADHAEAARLAQSPEVRAALAQEHDLLREESRFAHALDEWASQLGAGAGADGRLPPPDIARTLATLHIRSLQAHASDKDPIVADSAQRRLELAWVAAAHYLADEQQRRGDMERTRAALKLAAAIFPDRPYASCRLAGLANKQSLEDGVAACGASAVMNAR
jgi:predicted esterase